MDDEQTNTEPLEIEREWARAREEAGLSPRPGSPEHGGNDRPRGGALLSPYLVLYAGFFLGPLAALGSSLMVGPRDLTVRRVAVMFGICGAVWCGMQGGTVMLASSWSDVALQAVRSGFNFAGAVALMLFWRREVPGRFRHGRKAVVYSILVGLGLLTCFVLLPTSVLGVLGR